MSDALAAHPRALVPVDGATARVLAAIRGAGGRPMLVGGCVRDSLVRRLARRLGPATMTELAIVSAADRKGRGDPDVPSPADAWLEVAAGLQVQERPAKGLLTGHHLIAHGLAPGPVFKTIRLCAKGLPSLGGRGIASPSLLLPC